MQTKPKTFPLGAPIGIKPPALPFALEQRAVLIAFDTWRRIVDSRNTQHIRAAKCAIHLAASIMWRRMQWTLPPGTAVTEQQFGAALNLLLSYLAVYIPTLDSIARRYALLDEHVWIEAPDFTLAVHEFVSRPLFRQVFEIEGTDESGLQPYQIMRFGMLTGAGTSSVVETFADHEWLACLWRSMLIKESAHTSPFWRMLVTPKRTNKQRAEYTKTHGVYPPTPQPALLGKEVMWYNRPGEQTWMSGRVHVGIVTKVPRYGGHNAPLTWTPTQREMVLHVWHPTTSTTVSVSTDDLCAFHETPHPIPSYIKLLDQLPE